MQQSKYDEILTSIAGHYYEGLSANKQPTHDGSLATLKNDLLNFTAKSAEDPPWKLWLEMQKQCRKIADERWSKRRELRMSNEEIIFLSEAALHLRNHEHTLHLRAETIENVSAWKIDRNITAQDLALQNLPDYIWIEWPQFDKSIHPPWISRTVGMLVSRFAAFDAPRHRLAPLVERSDDGPDNTSIMIREVAKRVINGAPCLGYEIIAVQQDDRGYRFISCLLGHEHTEPLVDMLTLHKEMSDQDKRKYLQAEQVWSNVAIRILLLASHRKWYAGSNHPVLVEDDGLSTPPNTSRVLFATKESGCRKINIRPDYHTKFKPFAVTNV